MARNGFARQLTLALGVVIVLITAWVLQRVLLLIFAGILFAVLLRTAASWLSGRTRIPVTAAVAVVVLTLVLLVGAVFWARGPAIAQEVSVLRERLPEAISELQQRISATTWGRAVMERAPAAEDLMPEGADAVQRAGGILSRTLSAITGLVIVLFIGIALAAQPEPYLAGLDRLIPPARRQRAREVRDELANVLRRWLVGQLISMVAVGLMVGVGLWAIGIPLAFTLAMIAGVLEFIPYLGPILSGVPAVLLGFTESPRQALYVVGLFTVVQAIESWVIQPIVQWKAVYIPPALVVISQIAFGLLFGLLGVALAAPLTAAAMVLVQKLYVEDALGDTATAS